MMDHTENQCERAESYYILIVLGVDCHTIPKGLSEHINNCDRCRSKLDEMKKYLHGVNESTGSSVKKLPSYQADVLGMHIRYSGIPVNCKMARPLLPSLLNSELRIATSTPITKHISKCSSCQRDLSLLRELGVSPRHYRVLHELWTDIESDDATHCLTAAESIMPFVRLDFQHIKPEIMRHLCRCDVCQMLIDRARTSLINDVCTVEKPPTLCEGITSRDFFDCCFPSDRFFVEDANQRVNPRVVTHIKQCPRCLVELQKLNRRVLGIKHRAESGVVTTYHWNESAKQDKTASFHDSEQNIVATNQFNQDILGMKPRQLIKFSLAAAALLILTFILYNTPTASAVSIESIHNAIRSALNLHIQRFIPDRSDPMEDIWISRKLQLYLVKNNHGKTITDIKTRTLRVSREDTELFVGSQMNNEETNEYLKKMNGSFGVVPYPTDFPPNTVLHRLDSSTESSTNREAYELSWDEKLRNGDTVINKWCVFIKPGTYLPVNTEFYQTKPGSLEFELLTSYEIKYVSQESIQAVKSSWLP